MKKSKLITVLIAVAFGLTLVLSCVFLCVVRKIEVKFTVEENVDAESLQNSLNEKFKGKLFSSVKKDEIREAVGEYPYFELITVDKYFPNVIKVSVELRRETYKIFHEGENYLLDENGVVLGKEKTQSTEIINLSFDGISVKELAVGKKISTDKQNLVDVAFAMSKKVGLSDCITDMKILFGMAGEQRDVFFSTRTGVEIEVWKVDENGEEKAEKAFSLYDNCADDYVKSYDKILAYTEVNGEIKAEWTERG